MIFVTVGTHEQPFNRLIQEVDRLVETGVITEKVVIQKGYSTYEPKYCETYDLIPWEKVQELNKEARIVITHGGPSSFIDPLLLKKIPIVVPRQKKYNEHVNDHQLEFSKAVAERQKNLIVVENVSKLGNIVCNYTQIVQMMDSTILTNNLDFNEKLIKMVKGLFDENSGN